MSVAISSMIPGSVCTVTVFCCTLTVRRSSTPLSLEEGVRLLPWFRLLRLLLLPVLRRAELVEVPPEKRSSMLVAISLASAHFRRKVCILRFSHFWSSSRMILSYCWQSPLSPSTMIWFESSSTQTSAYWGFISEILSAISEASLTVTGKIFITMVPRS